MEYRPVAGFEDTEVLRTDIIETYIKLIELGYLIGTWGNISVRLDEGLLVTPSRIPIEEMKPEDLVVVSWEGKPLRGGRLPSSEMHLHRLLMLKRMDIGALIHTHSPYASALSCAHVSIPVVSEDMSQIIGGEVACTAYVPAGRHLDLGIAASRSIGGAATAVLLANHGSVVGGRNLEEALVATRVLEKAAMCLLLTGGVGGAKPIPLEYIEEERYRFLYKYGTERDTPQSR